MVFGQMNEPPGARMRVALSALTMVSISVMNKDKTFCYSSITFSDLLKQVQKYRIIGTYAVGYQPTLATEMGQLQERITSTNKGSVTSIQAVFVPPMTILTRATTAFAHLDATTNLERKLTEMGIYPAVDPLASTSRALEPELLVKSIMKWHEMSNQHFKNIENYKISLLF